MKTFKKKDIQKFKPLSEDDCKVCEIEETEIIDEEEVIDELVTSTGGEISGDEKNVNNSEIKTAPQATTDQFNSNAIQPNRYLYGVMGSAYSVGTRQGTMEHVNKEAKEKMLNLLEDMGALPTSNDIGTQATSNDMADINNNNITDTKELSQNVSSKLAILVNTVEKNNLNSEQVTMILNTLLEALIPRLDENGIQLIKDKFNA